MGITNNLDSLCNFLKNYLNNSLTCSIGQRSITVVTGTNNLAAAGWKYRSRQHIIHPGYNYNSLKNDVGLIMLNTSISFNYHVRPVVLPTLDFDSTGYPVAVPGWGTLAVSILLKQLTFFLKIQPVVIYDTFCFLMYKVERTNAEIIAIFKYSIIEFKRVLQLLPRSDIVNKYLHTYQKGPRKLPRKKTRALIKSMLF